MNLTDSFFGAIITFSVLGCAYLLNPGFKNFIDTEIYPIYQEHIQSYVPTYEDFKQGFDEGKSAVIKSN